MRPIKFRAWDKHSKRMLHNVGFHPSILEAHHLQPDSGYRAGEEDYTICPKFDNYVLLQFTGLLDKNGKEIYEGDVVKLKKFIGGNWVDHKIQRFVVVFDKFSFQLKPIDSATYTVSMVLGDDCEIEIIGNIYEHKHLLECE